MAPRGSVREPKSQREGGVAPVAGGRQAPASWVKKLRPGQCLPLRVQLRPLAAATPHAAGSSGSYTSP